MKPLKIYLLCASLIILTGCRKHGEPTQQQDKPSLLMNNEPTIIRLIREVAKILEQVYQNDSACKEVNAAIAKKKYSDERILIDDLLTDERSIFGRAFKRIAAEGNFPLTQIFLNRPRPRKFSKGTTTQQARIEEVESVVTDTGELAIYFPYSETFDRYQKPTIVAADRESDEGDGREPSVCSIVANRKVCFRDVLVNDDYAAARPTHIVTIGAKPITPPPPVPPSSAVSRVYMGWTRLTAQMDKLISFTGNGGGSEIKVCRINGYLRTKDEQVEDFDGDVVTLEFTRSDIRNKKWRRVYSIWDPEWNYQDVEQVYAVYEEDTKGEKSFSGSLTTTLNLPGKPSSGKIVGEIGFDITVRTQDQIITQREIGRSAYFKMSKINQGFGFMNDASDFLPFGENWPIYDGGTVWNYTMPYQTD